MRIIILSSAILALSCCAAVQAGPDQSNNQRMAALELEVASLRAQIIDIQKPFFGVQPDGTPITSVPGLPGYALDGSMKGLEAKEEVAELRERVQPLYAQGSAANLAMIQCVNQTCP